MPYPYAVKLLLWPSSSQTVDVLSPLTLAAGPDENIILVLSSGRAEITCDQAASSLNMEGAAVMGRNISVTVESKGAQPCRIIVLRIGTVERPPYIDLNHLCLTIPIIDAFFSYKQRFCILQDRGTIRPVFNAVIDEISLREPEWEKMTALRLQELLIQLARSFYAHDHPAGTQLLSAAREYIRAHYSEELTVGRIAAHVGISRSYLAQLFSAYLGYSTVDYIQAVRCDHAAYLLAATRFTILDIALNVGFNSRQHFTRTFFKIYAMTPMQYRKLRRGSSHA